ncbi:hypothetical protein JRO89_XS09G0201700 [Xanthoceras sorbifolium]|uniref:R13L1/DRL21-like LRR repeat region domain-containing protein n=1 Tax=Xanthoceras sorbifolium TaxID=99658 RepID=A0ABQ8HM36_9ROSI|nr:hypothetical protein JRO89_XS09G0201700 [Xanthoceras sorbifolium]
MEFIVSGSTDGCGSSNVCTLASLENLNHLGGYLCISGLGNVVDFCEAKKAELKKKKNLLHVDLFFNSNKEEGRTNEEDKFLLEALQPPSNLEQLKIAQYRGNTLSPSWLIPLTKLRRPTLSYCENCERLPPLGRLPSLEYLSVNNMSGLKRVGDEFLGIESDVASSSSSSSLIVAFPKLKYLKFESLDEWEEWDTTTRRREDEEDVVTIMPCLRNLTIDFCIELKALPDYIVRKTTLEELNINLCSKLKERYERGIGEDWSKISHIPNVNIESTLRPAYESQRDSFYSE